MRVWCDTLDDATNALEAAAQWLSAEGRRLGHDLDSCACRICRAYKETRQARNEAVGEQNVRLREAKGE